MKQILTANQTERATKGLETLNRKQRAFIDHYMITQHATKSAILAGYKPTGAQVQGSLLLSHFIIAAEIKRRTEANSNELTGRYAVSRARIQEELARLGFSNMLDYMKPGENGVPTLDFSTLTRDQAAALQEVTVEEFKDGRSDKREVRRIKFRLADKATALELLGKSVGLFTDKVEVEHTHTVVGMLLKEIDTTKREIVTVEHGPAECVLPPGDDSLGISQGN